MPHCSIKLFSVNQRGNLLRPFRPSSPHHESLTVALMILLLSDSFNKLREVISMQNNRRKYSRYRVKDNAFTVINPEPVKVVPIIDIGMGGLSIYLDNGARRPDPESKLEIMMADCSFYLEKLPFQIVADVRAFPNKSSSLMDGRRYGIKFGNLRPSQKSHLKYFIRNYTEGGYISQFQQKISKLLHPIWANKHTSDSCKPGIWQSLHRSSL